MRWFWVNFQFRGVLLIGMIVGQGPIALAVGAGGGGLDIFTLLYPFSPLSPALWQTARYRLKYCLKGPLNPKQSNPIHLYRIGHDDRSGTKMTTLTSILFESLSQYFPLIVSDAISCLLHNLNALWYIIIILYSYDKQNLTYMSHVQELQLSPLYFLSYLPLIVKATMPSILNTVRNIFMRLYGTVEEVLTVSCIKKYGGSCVSISPPTPSPPPFLSPPPPKPPQAPPPPQKKKIVPGFGFFVKIHSLESSKLDL